MSASSAVLVLSASVDSGPVSMILCLLSAVRALCGRSGVVCVVWFLPHNYALEEYQALHEQTEKSHFLRDCTPSCSHAVSFEASERLRAISWSDRGIQESFKT